jgi:hypothetical protein
MKLIGRAAPSVFWTLIFILHLSIHPSIVFSPIFLHHITSHHIASHHVATGTARLVIMSQLSTNAILQGMADALPTHKKDDDSSDLASSYEVIALLVHSYLAALDFRLCGFHQDKNLRMPFNPTFPFPLMCFQI